MKQFLRFLLHFFVYLIQFFIFRPMQKVFESKVIQQRVIYQGKWLGIKHVDYTIGEKIKRNYEVVFRTTSLTKKLAIDGVDIIPIIKYKEKPKEIVMIYQFRPSIKGYSLQFPTGMTEDNDFEANALRQLTEETGYIADKIIKIPTPALYCDPWKSNETSYLYIMQINGDEPTSFKGQNLEEEEDIKVVKFQLDKDLMNRVFQFTRQNNCECEGKVWSFCLGLSLKHELGKLN